MIEGLRRNGVEVIECHEQLWKGIEDRVHVVSGGWLSSMFLWRVICTYTRLLKSFWKVRNDFDILVVGYPGQVDVYLAWLLGKLTRKPVVWDIFMSIYLIATERELGRRNCFIVNLIGFVEKVACRLPDLLILDTAEYVAWFGQQHEIKAGRFRLVPTGADTTSFRPMTRQRPKDGLFYVVYYGTFIPNHGVHTIVEAAHLLENDETIHFELIGQGPEQELARQYVEQHHLSRVSFVNWLSQDVLCQRVADADLCLGVFGHTPQSLMTVQNKIYECLAMGKALISGDGPAVRQAFNHAEEIYLCPRSDAQALASAIRFLYHDADLRDKLGSQGNKVVSNQYSVESIGARFKAHLCALLSTGKWRGSPA
jgi:glycosyltransferase involved in cell wall biosynthesis